MKTSETENAFWDWLPHWSITSWSGIWRHILVQHYWKDNDLNTVWALSRCLATCSMIFRFLPPVRAPCWEMHTMISWKKLWPSWRRIILTGQGERFWRKPGSCPALSPKYLTLCPEFISHPKIYRNLNMMAVLPRESVIWIWWQCWLQLEPVFPILCPHFTGGKPVRCASTASSTWRPRNVVVVDSRMWSTHLEILSLN